MVDPRLILAAFLLASVIGGVVIGLLLRGGSGGGVDVSGLRQWIEGKKTYVGMVLLAVNNYAARRGWIDDQFATDLNTALALLTGAAFIAKANRIEQKVETATTAAKIAAVTRPKETL